MALRGYRVPLILNPVFNEWGPDLPNTVSEYISITLPNRTDQVAALVEGTITQHRDLEKYPSVLEVVTKSTAIAFCEREGLNLQELIEGYSIKGNKLL